MAVGKPFRYWFVKINRHKLSDMCDFIFSMIKNNVISIASKIYYMLCVNSLCFKVSSDKAAWRWKDILFSTIGYFTFIYAMLFFIGSGRCRQYTDLVEKNTTTTSANTFLCCTWKGIIRIYFILKRNWAEETYESDNIFSRPEFVCFLLQARRSSVRGGCWLLWCCPCLLLQVQPVQLLMLRDYWL